MSDPADHQDLPQPRVQGTAEINLYFNFDLFSEVAEIQFEVDDGVLATSVTRAWSARSVTPTAFVGDLPVPRSCRGPERQRAAPCIAVLPPRGSTSRCDRGSRRWFIVGVDTDGSWTARRRSARSSSTIWTSSAAGGRRSATAISRSSGGSSRRSTRSSRYQNVRDAVRCLDRTIAAFLPPEDYDDGALETVRSILLERGYDIEQLPWPPILDRHLHARVGQVDWILTDLGDASTRAGDRHISPQVFYPHGAAPARSWRDESAI